MSPPFFCFELEGSGVGVGVWLGREEAGSVSGLGVTSGVSSSYSMTTEMNGKYKYCEGSFMHCKGSLYKGK